MQVLILASLLLLQVSIPASDRIKEKGFLPCQAYIKSCAFCSIANNKLIDKVRESDHESHGRFCNKRNNYSPPTIQCFPTSKEEALKKFDDTRKLFFLWY